MLSFFGRKIKSDWVFRLAALGALVTSLLFVARSCGMPLQVLSYLPLSSLGFGWVVPSAVCGALGLLVPQKN